jgi:adenosylhomocysteine nucleosidase
MIVIAISAFAEWDIVKKIFPNAKLQKSVYGEWFKQNLEADVIFFHQGWGKIAAAGATQYAIDKWRPELIINLGTCGGFEGSIEKGEIILVEKTIVYDIIEQMGDAAEAIADYTADLDIKWAGDELPYKTRRGLLLSADRDIVKEELKSLKQNYQGIAADWESGAIAWVANKNNTPALILRGVSDTVSEIRAEAYEGDYAFEKGTELVMRKLVDQLPLWVNKWQTRESLGKNRGEL